LLGLLADPAAGPGDDGASDVGDVLGTHEVGVLHGHAVLLGIDAALQQRVVDDVGQGAVGDLVIVEAGTDGAADALGVVGDVDEHLLGLDRVRLYVDVQADVLVLQPVHLVDEPLSVRLEPGRLLGADLACHLTVDGGDSGGDLNV